MFFIVPPAAPEIAVSGVSTNHIMLTWQQPSVAVDAYELHFRREYGQWDKESISGDINSYKLSDLACGSSYQMYLLTFNRVGSGTPSKVVTAQTQGSGIVLQINIS